MKRTVTKDDVILVAYIDVRDIAIEDTGAYLQAVADHLKAGGVFMYVIPVKADSHIDCINPKLLSEKEFEEANEMLEKIREKFEEMNEKIRGEK